MDQLVRMTKSLQLKMVEEDAHQGGGSRMMMMMMMRWIDLILRGLAQSAKDSWLVGDWYYVVCSKSNSACLLLLVDSSGLDSHHVTEDLTVPLKRFLYFFRQSY